MKTQNIKLYTHSQGVFVVVLQVVIFLTAFFMTTTSFAQEKKDLKETPSSEKTELVSEENAEKEITPIIEDIKPVKAEFSKEQKQQLNKLDQQLKKGKITQEQYNRLKNELLDIKPEPIIEAEALMARASEVEPEAQTLGK